MISPSTAAARRIASIWSVSMVRNEADIVEAWVRHNLTVLDGMAIIDHGSIDTTLDILKRLAAERLPLLLFDSKAPGYLQEQMTTALARQVFARTPAEFVLPLDADEFVKTPSRDTLRRALAAIPTTMHGLLHWLTYVPDFSAPTAGILPLLRGARRRSVERQVFHKAVVTRHLVATPEAMLGAGNHYVAAALRGRIEDAPPHARVRPEHAAIAHVPIRSAGQLVAKVAIKKLARIAAGTDWQPDAASQAAYDTVVAGCTLDEATLTHRAVNWSVPCAWWENSDDVTLVDDAFLAPVTLSYTPPVPASAVPIVLTVVALMVTRLAAARRPR